MNLNCLWFYNTKRMSLGRRVAARQPLLFIMRTYIYIDGFNFYYLAVRYSKFKWLDFMSMFEKLLTSKNNIIKIKYFTANVSGKYDQNKPIRQNMYLRALKSYIPEIEIIKGHFQTHEIMMPLASNPQKRVKVLKTEEEYTKFLHNEDD